VNRMTIELESMAVGMPEVKGHPNRVAFRGVLTLVDIPSQRAPLGSKGKRVLLTRKAAEKAIPSLLGMAVDYAPSLDQHDQQRKVGVITSADIGGQNLEVGGYLYGKDFPEIVQEIGRAGKQSGEDGRTRSGMGLQASDGTKSLQRRNEGATLRASLATAVKEVRRMIDTARNRPKPTKASLVMRSEITGSRDPGAASSTGGALGMSFEVTNVKVLDRDARIWRLIDVTFTGAAILRKDKAAYPETWIQLS
jgi:hypothetical protein